MRVSRQYGVGWAHVWILCDFLMWRNSMIRAYEHEEMRSVTAFSERSDYTVR